MMVLMVLLVLLRRVGVLAVSCSSRSSRSSRSCSIHVAVAATVVAVAAADIVAIVRTCNCYCGLVGCRQIVAFAFAMHDGFGISCSYVWISRSYNRNCSRDSVSRSCSIRSRCLLPKCVRATAMIASWVASRWVSGYCYACRACYVWISGGLDLCTRGRNCG